MTEAEKYYDIQRLSVSSEWPVGYDIAIIDNYRNLTIGMSVAQAKALVDAITVACADCEARIREYEATVQGSANDSETSESVGF